MIGVTKLRLAGGRRGHINRGNRVRPTLGRPGGWTKSSCSTMIPASGLRSCRRFGNGYPAPVCEDAPSDGEILRSLPKWIRGVPYFYEEFHDDHTFQKTRVVDKIDPPRFFPLVGMAQLHHCHWECAVYYTETIQSAYPYPTFLKRPRVQGCVHRQGPSPLVRRRKPGHAAELTPGNDEILSRPSVVEGDRSPALVAVRQRGRVFCAHGDQEQPGHRPGVRRG